MTTKPKILLYFGVILFTLIFTFNILQFFSQQQYQNAIAQQQTNNETTSSNSNNTNVTTKGSIPENARGPAITQDKGYLIQELGDNLYFLTNGAYNTMFMVSIGTSIMSFNVVIAILLLPGAMKLYASPCFSSIGCCGL
jgi:hypothetical protein